MRALLEAEKALRAVSDKIGENISDTTIAAKEKGSAFAEESGLKLMSLKPNTRRKSRNFLQCLPAEALCISEFSRRFRALKTGGIRLCLTE